MQKSINKILCLLYAFMRAYIDNIVTNIYLFEKYVADLQAIFNFCIHFNILINLTKFFLNYPSIIFLGQYVNSFRLTIVKKKVAVVKIIEYLTMFDTLKYFLKLTKYLRSSIYYYI